jgi:hypothetical protein
MFVHRQDIIDIYEKNNKLSKHFGDDYTYIFLGNGNYIENEKTIVSRNFPDNIENYPLAVAYTGWYIIWKNLKIDSKYINLFEYDVKFKDINKILESSDSDFKYYIELPLHTLYYDIMVQSRVYKRLEKNLDKWMVTTNLTIRTEVFYEFMEWFHTNVFNIDRDIRNIGHIFERYTTYFANIHNKSMLYLPEVIEHFQLNSHNTCAFKRSFEEYLERLID